MIRVQEVSAKFTAKRMKTRNRDYLNEYGFRYYMKMRK